MQECWSPFTLPVHPIFLLGEQRCRSHPLTTAAICTLLSVTCLRDLVCWPANTWRSTPDNSQAPIVLHNIPVYKSEQPSVDISELSSPQPGFSNLPAFLLLLALLLHLRGCRRTCGSPHVPQMAEICQAAWRLLREEIRRGSSSKAFPTWCHGILANKGLQVPNTR